MLEIDQKASEPVVENLTGIRFTITDYGTIERAGDGSVIGIYPTEDEALEDVREQCMGVLSSVKT
ncbi:MAG: hypothetical protein PUF75_00210 [Coprococcus sp.]|nr:hypothetical protein [Coprococcus sp.]